MVCIKKVLSYPNSLLTCLMASKNGRDSISPTVPPISTIHTSVSLLALKASYILFLISLVICGIIWIVAPKNSPFLSLSKTVVYTFPLVTLLSLVKEVLIILS